MTAVICAILLATCSPTAQDASARIVAIGDIHGALESLTTILRTTGLIDAEGKWSGGRSRLVQTGDFLDRGVPLRQVMDLLMRLEGEARRAGGRVDVLFGNHEGMNIMRDTRDVSPQTYAAFADDDSESRRKRAFDAHAAAARRVGKEIDREEWFRTHPPGTSNTSKPWARPASTAAGFATAKLSSRSTARCSCTLASRSTRGTTSTT